MINKVGLYVNYSGRSKATSFSNRLQSYLLIREYATASGINNMCIIIF